MKEKIVVICPGRGTYTKESLGTLNNPQKEFEPYLEEMNQYRTSLDLPTISELDQSENFSAKIHTIGENASLLIYACAIQDYLKINSSRFEVCAILGNSMGWYITLGLGAAIRFQDSCRLIQEMGSMMKDGLIGGQVIYPVVDDNWNHDSQKDKAIEKVLGKIAATAGAEVYNSIILGGYKVFGGNKIGLKLLLENLPKVEGRYPFQLFNHGAFHTPLLQPVSDQAQTILSDEIFTTPKSVLIDGRGKLWNPLTTDSKKLREYTLGHQVTQAYDFTRSVEIALQEFAPDRLVLLGPGQTLGGSIGHILVKNKWRGIQNKADFQNLQKSKPFLLSMGIPEQAEILY